MVALMCVRAGVAAALIVAAGHAIAAQPSGTVIAVIQSAEVDSVTGQKVLQPLADIFSGDRINTGRVGEAQIKFRDNTKLVVGPNSSMVIDAFVFNNDDTARQISINAVRGAFRFITGNSSKDAYSITTPTATIGVRGTEFDVSVEPTGVTRVAAFSGVTIQCPRDSISGPIDRTQCIETTDPCTVSVIRPNRNIQRLTDTRDRARDLNWYFRYVRDQSMLLDDFQVSLKGCTSAATLPETAPPTVAPSPDAPPPPPPTPPPDRPDKPDKPSDPPDNDDPPGGDSF